MATARFKVRTASAMSPPQEESREREWRAEGEAPSACQERGRLAAAKPGLGLGWIALRVDELLSVLQLAECTFGVLGS